MSERGRESALPYVSLSKPLPHQLIAVIRHSHSLSLSVPLSITKSISSSLSLNLSSLSSHYITLSHSLSLSLSLFSLTLSLSLTHALITLSASLPPFLSLLCHPFSHALSPSYFLSRTFASCKGRCRWCSRGGSFGCL